MACKSCSKKRKRRGVGAASAMDLDFKKIACYGAGAVIGALSNKAIVKAVKETGDPKKDANRGMLIGAGKAILGGYMAATQDDETVQDIAIGFAAEGILETAMYLFAVPIAAYPKGIKGTGIGYTPYSTALYIPGENGYDPMMPERHIQVAGMAEAQGFYPVAGMAEAQGFYPVAGVC